ncbi:MAG: hypothetical protein GEU90_17760 [Gemmatimonas sp.]|nr:hypothetical protein [Gemmatimonas sp.]
MSQRKRAQSSDGSRQSSDGSRGAEYDGTVLARGLGFTEGPAVLPDGRVLFASLSGTLYEVNGDGVQPIAETGFGPTGTAVDAGGEVFVAGMSGVHGTPDEIPGGVYRWSADDLGPVVTESVTAPNDICFGPDGRLYFTDPGDDPAALFDAPIPGWVCAYDLESRELTVLDRTGFYPNGIAFDASGERLYVSESYSKRVVEYRLTAGALSDKRVVVELEATPDGMAVDVDGHIWQCVNPLDAILVVDPNQAAIIDRFATGEGSYPSNCCFGGDDRSLLYVTAAGEGAIKVFHAGVRGLALCPERDADGNAA